MTYDLWFCFPGSHIKKQQQKTKTEKAKMQLKLLQRKHILKKIIYLNNKNNNNNKNKIQKYFFLA